MSDSDTIAMTLASLVKNNNGKFKSEAQAKYIFATMAKHNGNDPLKVDTAYWDSIFSVYRHNSGYIRYVANRDGVIARYNMNRDMHNPDWTPVGVPSVTGNAIPPQVESEIKRLVRLQRSCASSIISRKQARADGKYDASESLYNQAMTTDMTKLVNIMTALNDIDKTYPNSVPFKKLMKV